MSDQLGNSPRRADAGTCSACGYSLSGLALDANCPECGASPDERQRHGVGSASTRAVLAMGLAGLAWLGVLGFGVLAIVLGILACWTAAVALMRDGGSRQPGRGTRIVALIALVFGAGAVFIGFAVAASLGALL